MTTLKLGASSLLTSLLVIIPSSVSSSAGLTSGSLQGQNLLSQSRRLQDNNDLSFIGDYSVKFQGCHHVQQWNDNADEEGDVRIKTKRLARYRLCPEDSCNNDRTAGCTTKFGDYIVDMDTFVYNYLNALEEQKDNICADAAYDCQEQCSGYDDDCMTSCYEGFGLGYCIQDEDNGFNPMEYVECQAFNFGNRRLNDGNVQYYIGPHCAAQGGEIHLGIFTDDTCTTMAEYGESDFYDAMGYQLPYSQSSIVSNRCFQCGMENDNGNVEISEMCQNIYQNAGKCETRMAIDYPNESSCDYIEGIKVIRDDGVIRTSSVRKSKSAAVAIGVFMTLSVLLAGYVFYLRTKLARAQINLAASSQPLT